MEADQVLRGLWQMAEADPTALASVCFVDTDRSLPSSFQVGPVAAATIAAQALAAAQLWQARTGQAQSVEVSMRRALAMFRSERCLTVDGKAPKDPYSPIFGYYRTVDGRWIQLHTNFPHHHQGVLRVLACDDSRDAVARAIVQRNAAELEQRLADAGLCAAWVRTAAEWQAHPQAAASAALPLFEIERIGDAPPEPIGRTGSALRPLSGVRVLDLSRVIAAPVAARTLAQHGADVLAIGAAHLPNIDSLVIDTGRGKRSARLDLRDASGQAALRDLVRGADVFLQAYRPGALAAQGFDPRTLSELRPGLVQVCLSAYGHEGPWAQRRGFDSLVQSATGIAHDEGLASGLLTPGKLPCQANDHATGYLAAFGAMIALQRRAQEGGSWRVRVSLAQTGHWLRSLGRDTAGVSAPELSEDEIAPWRHTMPSAFGLVSAIAPVERMSVTPPYFELPPAPPGTHAPEWQD
jgi:crotonobetainyl-CoA:carnitine CoA-transferase CaiB-like acyl-CoA transferase